MTAEAFIRAAASYTWLDRAVGANTGRWWAHAGSRLGLTWTAHDCAEHGHPCGVHVHADGGRILWIAHGDAYGYLAGDCIGHVLNVDHPEILDLRVDEPRSVAWSPCCNDCAGRLGWDTPCHHEACRSGVAHNVAQHAAALGASRGLVSVAAAAVATSADTVVVADIMARYGGR